MKRIKYLWRLLTGKWVQCDAQYTLHNALRPSCQKPLGHFGPHKDSMGWWER